MKFDVEHMVASYISAVDGLIASHDPDAPAPEPPSFGGHRLMVQHPRLTIEKAKRIRNDLVTHMLVQTETIEVEGGFIGILTWRAMDASGSFPVLSENDHRGTIFPATKAIAYDKALIIDLCQRAEREFKQQVKAVVNRRA